MDTWNVKVYLWEFQGKKIFYNTYNNLKDHFNVANQELIPNLTTRNSVGEVTEDTTSKKLQP